MQFIQAGSRGKKVPLAKSKIFIGNASMLPATIDALVSFELGSLGNTVDAALIFSGDLIYLMDVDYSCLSTLKFPCLNAQVLTSRNENSRAEPFKQWFKSAKSVLTYI